MGNTPFKGENLKLDPIDITAFNYTQLKFLYKWNKKIETNVGLILGHHLLNANVNKGYFYTDSQASFINYELDYEAHFTNSADLRQNPYSNNGYGASFGICYKDSIDKGSIEITINHIGFINWNKKTTNMYIKTKIGIKKCRPAKKVFLRFGTSFSSIPFKFNFKASRCEI